MYATARSGNAGAYFASPECARLDASTGGQFLARAPPGCPVPHTVGAIELGFDFGQCFSFKERSTGALIARCVRSWCMLPHLQLHTTCLHA